MVPIGHAEIPDRDRRNTSASVGAAALKYDAPRMNHSHRTAGAKSRSHPVVQSGSVSSLPDLCLPVAFRAVLPPRRCPTVLRLTALRHSSVSRFFTCPKGLSVPADPVVRRSVSHRSLQLDLLIRAAPAPVLSIGAGLFPSRMACVSAKTFAANSPICVQPFSKAAASVRAPFEQEPLPWSTKIRLRI